MANKKLQLRDAAGNRLFPRTTVDNIQKSLEDGTTVQLAVLDANGKLPLEYLDAQLDVIEILTIAAVAPATCKAGDKYYNSTYNKIYTAPADNTWSDDATAKADPEEGKIYMNLATDTLWRYNGTDALVELSAHINVIQNIDGVEDASTEEVPSEKAVAAALAAKQNTLTPATPLDINSGNTISLKYGQGLDEVDETLVVPQSFVVDTVSTQMLEDTIAASPETALVSGGTTYTIVGSYEVTDTIGIDGEADDTKIATEKAVRDAVNAYVATGGSDIIAGDGIKMAGGAINIDEATESETRTDSDGTGVVSDKVVTPHALHSALSLAQGVDVSCNAKASGFDTIQYNADASGTATGDDTMYAFSSDTFKNDTSKFLGTFTLRKAATANSGYQFGFNNSSTNKFPKSADGLKYLIIADVKNNGTINWGASSGFYCYGYTSTTVGDLPQMVPAANRAASQTAFVRIAGLFRGNEGKGFLQIQAGAAGTVQCQMKNFRVYEVTALTDEAIESIAKMDNPDDFFRNPDVYTLLGKYMMRQDMVSPWIPIISMPDNSDLTIGAGLAYKLKFTDNKTHKITVDTFPSNGYGWDAHLQLFVNNASLVQFEKPLNLLTPLTPNAGHNLTVKFRGGQANVYVDDTDVGYVVTVTSGDGNGSLAYGLTNSAAGDYIVFADSTDGQNITAPESVVFSKSMNVIGNGPDKTVITSPVSFAAESGHAGDYVYLINLAISGTTVNTPGSGLCYFVARNVLIDNCVNTDTVFVDAKDIQGSTISNSTMDNHGVKLSLGIMTDSLITGNTSTGIVVYANTGSGTSNTASVQNCTISGNTSDKVLYASGAGTTNVTGSTFTDNVPVTTGAATIVVGDGTTVATKGVLNGNEFTNSDIEVKSGSTVTFSGVNVLNSTVSGSGQIVFANGSTITSTGDGSADAPRGTFNCAGHANNTPYIPAASKTFTLDNITVTGCTHTGYGNFINAAIDPNTAYNIVLKRIVATSAAGGSSFLCFQLSGNYTLEDCQFDTKVCSVYITSENANLVVKNCTFVATGGLNDIQIYKGSADITNTVVPYIYPNSSDYSLKKLYLTGCTCSKVHFAPNRGYNTLMYVDGGTASNIVNYDAQDTTKKCYIFVAANKVTRIHKVDCAYNIAVGSYDNDRTIFTVGGSFTLVTSSGSSVTVAGIGTYINSDGSNDFSSPYVVNNSNSSGSGSLINGIVGEAKWLVVSHDVSADLSATLSSDITDRSMFITAGDGRIITGGTISLPEGSTVGVHVDKDESGVPNIPGSTVSISGGTPTFSGTCIIGGTLLLGENATLANGTTISGVGTGCKLTSISAAQHELRISLGSSTTSIKNITIDKFILKSTANGASDVSLSGVTINTELGTYGSIQIVNNHHLVTLNNCKIQGTYTTATFCAILVSGYNARCAVENCDILQAIALHTDNRGLKYIYLKGTNKLKAVKSRFADASATGNIYIASGSVLNFSYADNQFTSVLLTSNGTISVGTWNGVNWVEGGTATVIVNGTTTHISGSGTYFYKDGTTDLTVVS